MNILIVDDQPAVIKGVLAGVDWNRLRIESQYTAENIFEAKDIIRSHPVELMLCDIEMPMGSGLELYEWVVEEKYDIKCIFLTAHSDFSYAQKAVHLQGFDYLLQPASYREIEESLQKAVETISRNGIISDYFQYALDLKKREKEHLTAILRDYLLELRSDTPEVIHHLSLLSFRVGEDTVCRAALMQCFDSTGPKWENELKLYAIDNVINELLANQVGKVIVVCLRNEEFVLLCRMPEGKVELRDDLKCFQETAESLFQCKVALYLEDPVCFQELPLSRKRLEKMVRRNVTKKNGIVEPTDRSHQIPEYTAPDVRKWERFVEEGYFDLVRKEAEQYLDRLDREGSMNEETLRCFHQDYMYLFLSGIKKYGEEKQGMYLREESDYNYEAMMNSYTSVTRLRQLIEFTMNYLKGLKNPEEMSESRMEEILNYIHKNIQKNITRKDVADAVYLNPEYLSRLFRKEYGMKLSDYILQEKMNIGKNLLETTNFSVSIVASKVGYSNFSHFAQAFKRIFGVSPSEIRQGNLK